MIDHVTYLTRDVDSPYKERRLHANQIKPFRTLDELVFVDPTSELSTSAEGLHSEPKYDDSERDSDEVLLLSAVRPR